MRHIGPRLAFCFMLLFSADYATAQQACPAAPALATSSGTNIFQPQQETDLGDLMAEQMDSRYQVIDDPDLTQYLQRIAARLADHLPPTGLRFQVFLIDTPVIDAFSIPGGRIYVSRKMVAFLRNDDEIAGLLGHEMGHSVSHQPAVEMSMLFQRILSVRQVSSREDIAAKYNQLLDNAARRPAAFKDLASQEEPDQYVADQIALYAAAGAAYSPRATLDFFDRLAQTHGRTGGTFSDLFGLTSPDEKRLGIMQKAFAAMPATCVKTDPVTVTYDFQKWQSDVIAFSGLSRPENLPGLLTRHKLDPPLRGDIDYFRFSPDGQYALAQDESSIFVLTRQPFALLFRIDARDARPASFTPDSKNIVFSTPGLRVEDWNIAKQERVSVHEMAFQEGCVQSLVSPDGKNLACLIERMTSSGLPYLDLQVLDVASGDPLFIQRNFLGATFQNALFLAMAKLLSSDDPRLARMAFSPDGEQFIAASPSMAVAVDTKSRKPIPLHGSLNDMLKWGFTFLATDKIIAVTDADRKKSAILSFPSGQLIKNVPYGSRNLDTTTQGNYLLLRPVQDALVGAVDLNTNKGVVALKQSAAIDVFDQQFIAEGTTGEIGLFDLATSQARAKAQLPVSPLGRLRAGAVSADFHWLAASGTNRGAVWDLSNTKQLLLLHGFRGAFLDGNTLYADFPKYQQTDRAIARVDLDTKRGSPAVPLDTDSTARQYGPYLVLKRPNRKDGSVFEDVTLAVQDVRTGNPLWSLSFPKDAPAISVSGDDQRIVLSWPSINDGAQDEIKKHETLTKQFAAMNEHNGVFLLEVLEARTGHSLGAALVDTGLGSFRIEDIYSAGDWLLVSDNQNRTLVYSITDGKLAGSIFGLNSVLSPAANLLATENEAGQIQIYGLPRLDKRSHVSFTSPVAMARFAVDGKTLFVLTLDQQFYTFDAAALAKPSPN